MVFVGMSEAEAFAALTSFRGTRSREGDHIAFDRVYLGSSHDTLSLSFTNGVLSCIVVEENSDEPKNVPEVVFDKRLPLAMSSGQQLASANSRRPLRLREVREVRRSLASRALAPRRLWLSESVELPRNFESYEQDIAKAGKELW